MIDIKLHGMKELQAQLLALPERVGRNVLRSTVNAGATVIRKEAERRVPVRSGALKRGLYQKQIREKSGPTQQTYYVGWRKKKGKADPFYGSFVEFGTSKMAARPFLRPAFEATKQRAVERMREKMRERIAMFLSKGARP